MIVFGYILYLLITFYITIVVGRVLYKNGEVFLVRLFATEPEKAHHYNRFLLTGYYLLNLGYASVSLVFWGSPHSLPAMLGELASRTGTIVLSLGLMHYVNMLVFTLLAKYQSKPKYPTS